MDYNDSSYFQPVRDDIDYAPHLKKDYCSSLVLVTHFEENHVTVISPNGAPVPPLSPISPCDAYSASSALALPRTPYMSTPMMSPVCKKEEEHVLDTMLPCGVYDSNPGAVWHPQQPLTCHPQIYIPPAHLFLAPARCAPPHYTTSYPLQPTIAPTPVDARQPNLSIITDIQAEPEAEDELGFGPLKPAKRQEGENSTSSASKEGVCKCGRDVLLGLPQGKAQTHWRHTKASTGTREKIHKCPSYLNRNGLKYHLMKGVCDFGHVYIDVLMVWPYHPVLLTKLKGPVIHAHLPPIHSRTTIRTDDAYTIHYTIYYRLLPAYSHRSPISV
ncbi:hypothetical protein K439DRAFT_1639294 [Ramaria rubella]|nr:hypothetical protein K439DRAFT_1639294 [Ramaria rubella]